MTDEQDKNASAAAWAKRVGGCNANRHTFEPEKAHFVAGWDAACAEAVNVRTVARELVTLWDKPHCSMQSFAFCIERLRVALADK